MESYEIWCTKDGMQVVVLQRFGIFGQLMPIETFDTCEEALEKYPGAAEKLMELYDETGE